MSFESATETAAPMAADADVAAHSSGHAIGRPVAVPAARSGAGALALLRDYVALTKPRIISLLLLTTVATMFVADPSGPPLATILWTMLGGYLAAGGAGAINHYLDRDRDARMARTRRRPLVSGRIEPLHGLVFGIALGALAVAAARAHRQRRSRRPWRWPACSATSSSTRSWLKPLTPQNIVIGGAAGAVPPLVGWAAATGSLALDALWPFAIVFLWTPPHFWALALLIKDDYARTGVPMLPVVARRGRDAAPDPRLLAAPRRRSPLLPVRRPASSGPSTLAAAVALGAAFVAARGAARAPSRRVRPRCGSTSPRSPTSRCCSARWPSTGSWEPDRKRRPWTARPRQRTSSAGLVAGALAIADLRAHVRRRDPLHRLMASRRAATRGDRAGLRARALVAADARARRASR